jgi:hypothetical protein
MSVPEKNVDAVQYMGAAVINKLLICDASHSPNAYLSKRKRPLSAAEHRAVRRRTHSVLHARDKDWHNACVADKIKKTGRQ